MPTRSMPTKKAMAMIAIPASFCAKQPLRWIEPGGAAERLRRQPVGKPHGRIEDRQRDQDLDQCKQGEAAAADREADPVQHTGHCGEPADRIGQHGDKRAGGKQVGDPAGKIEAPRKAAHQQRRRDRRRKTQHQRRQSRPGIDTQRDRQHQPRGEIADQCAQPGRHSLRANRRSSSPKDRRGGPQLPSNDPGERAGRDDNCRCSARGRQIGRAGDRNAQECRKPVHPPRPRRASAPGRVEEVIGRRSMAVTLTSLPPSGESHRRQRRGRPVRPARDPAKAGSLDRRLWPPASQGRGTPWLLGQRRIEGDHPTAHREPPGGLERLGSIAGLADGSGRLRWAGHCPNDAGPVEIVLRSSSQPDNVARYSDSAG